MRPTAEQYGDWQRRIAHLKDEVEQAHGENAQGVYPHPLEMTLHLAWSAAYKAQRDAEQPTIV
jgi:hypothetical protein